MESQRLVFLARRCAAPAVWCAGAVLMLCQVACAGEAADLAQRALALKRAGQLAASAAVYRRAIGLDSALVDAHWGLAWVLAAQGRKAEAATEFRQVLALAREGPLAQEAASALKRLGFKPSEGVHTPDHPPRVLPPAPAERPLTVARRLIAAGEAFQALRLLQAMSDRDLDWAEAVRLLGEVKRGRRKVRVVAVADQVLRAQAGWEARLRDRFAFAAQEIGRQVEIDLVLTGVKPWQRRLATSDGLDLVEELEAAAPLDETEAVVGFVAEQRPVELVDGQPTVRGYTLGLSPCLTGYVVVAEVIGTHNGQPYRVPEGILRENLIHELGHLFGAVHVSGLSVMRASTTPPPVYDFDALNLEVMRTCRWTDFRENLASLSVTELQRMADLYAELEAGPPSDDGVHFYRASVCTMLERYGDAITEYEQVLAFSPGDAFTHYNLAELLYYQQKDLERARAHWKIAEAIGRPVWVADLARKALAEQSGTRVP